MYDIFIVQGSFSDDAANYININDVSKDEMYSLVEMFTRGCEFDVVIRRSNAGKES